MSEIIIDTWEGSGDINEQALVAEGVVGDIVRWAGKTCSKCGKIKTTEKFTKNTRYRDGLQSYCKQCMSNYSNAWNKKNPAKRKAICKKWRDGNQRLVISLARSWNITNADKKREINRSWNKRHNKQVRMMEKSRYYKEKNAPGNGIIKNEWDQLKEEYFNRCVYCGKVKKLELDHIIPISKGGAHEIINAVPACRTCNSRKNNNPLILFLYKEMIRRNSEEVGNDRRN
jgi:5-methylcytosine-specific restriction endonuclease McrA